MSIKEISGYALDKFHEFPFEAIDISKKKRVQEVIRKMSREELDELRSLIKKNAGA